MNDKPTQSKSPPQSAPAGSKEERLAAALRSNLRRRKAPRAASPVDDTANPASEKPEDPS